MLLELCARGMRCCIERSRAGRQLSAMQRDVRCKPQAVVGRGSCLFAAMVYWHCRHFDTAALSRVFDIRVDARVPAQLQQQTLHHSALRLAGLEACPLVDGLIGRGIACTGDVGVSKSCADEHHSPPSRTTLEIHQTHALL